MIIKARLTMLSNRWRCHLMSPEESFNPGIEPEPYDLWFLSSTRDQTQDAANQVFFFFLKLGFFLWFFVSFCAIFYISCCWEGERTTDFFFVFLLVSSTGLRRCQGGVVFIKGIIFGPKVGPKKGCI